MDISNDRRNKYKSIDQYLTNTFTPLTGIYSYRLITIHPISSFNVFTVDNGRQGKMVLRAVPLKTASDISHSGSPPFLA